MPRFFRPPQWRLAVTDGDSATITLLDKLATEKKGTFQQHAPARMAGTVPASSPEINILHTDGFTLASDDVLFTDYPFLHEGVRLLYGFRREAVEGEDPWVCRFGGIIMDITDSASASDVPRSRFTAYDPWQYLYHRPVRLADGSLPGVGGRRFPVTSVIEDVLGEIMFQTIDVDGPCRIDVPAIWGGTAFYGGEWNPPTTTLSDKLIFGRGTMVGEALVQIVELLSEEIAPQGASVGAPAIRLRPIYDPDNRPGYLAEMDLMPTVDPALNRSVLSWDRTGRSVYSIERAIDGNERANRIRWHNVFGVPLLTSSGLDSITQFGEYWNLEQLPHIYTTDALSHLVEGRRQSFASGRRTLRVGLTPGHDIIPWRDFDLGCKAQVYNSSALRWDAVPPNSLVPNTYIQGWTIDIGDDRTESISDLLVSADTTLG